MKMTIIAAITLAMTSCFGPSEAEKEARQREILLAKEAAEALEATEKALQLTEERLKADRAKAEAALQDAGTSDAGKKEAQETLEALRGVEEAAAEVKRSLDGALRANE